MINETINLTFRDQMKVLARLLKYVFPYKRLISLAFLMLILTTVAGVMVPYLVMIFIDNYLSPMQFPEQDISILIILFFIVEIIAVVCGYFQAYLFQVLAFKVIQQLRIDSFEKIGTLGMKYFDVVPSGSVVSRLTNDTQSIVDMFVSVLSTFMMALFMVLSSFVMMFILDFKLAFIAFLFVPIIVLIIGIYRKYSAIYFGKARGYLSELNAKIAESIDGMNVIQAFNQEERLQKEFEETNHNFYHYNVKNIKLDGLLLRPAFDMIYILAISIILSYFGVMSFGSVVTAGVVFAFIQYMERFFEPINQVSQNLNILQQALVSASRVFTLMDDERHEPEQIKETEVITDGHIEFKNVTFSYDGKVDVLKNISFEVKPGETVALVGHTGSGKSSIINLIMRFYEFNEGDILIDSHSIKNISRESMKKNIGLVLQDPFVFYGTVESNIKLYHPTMTFEEVKRAAEFVSANTFIEALPEGYHQKVTEKGSSFSSGERQLLAFARTIATEPKILILDEATANIDSRTEEEIQKSLEKMRKNRTTLAIAHRLSTIQDADQIIVLNRGEIVEKGTHLELIAMKGIYHKMYQLQNGITNLS
ncbi:ABC transporter ATP-binding protein [Phocicoccus pinnipedialis]|uniref:Putative multidrug resistance ABC transporter ATP-binding/permease protein YheH n=1 Tax=Phocicoccus pinnipedialis TaxID=110845 RepID=A0A6V7RFZ5_9BACL|nr:ABC transporter ATP-binding protein [Jeotgalicoccus pinnipedialis]MBP1939180.1 ATP-binding cassette subfamily B protein [Jeotgalicoccus pinnipedialis]CAD2076419.1 putative multidrug resistance ABC transporter ATP-binding/permease protein YheH [Jeotgalicoccus pinnipedialis]